MSWWWKWQGVYQKLRQQSCKKNYRVSHMKTTENISWFIFTVDLVILENVGLSLKFKSWLLEMASWRVKCERLKSIEFANDAPWCVDSIFAPPCIAAVSRSLFLFCYELHAANSFWEFYLCPHLSLTPWISPCHVVIESKCITRGRGRYELWEAS